MTLKKNIKRNIAPALAVVFLPTHASADWIEDTLWQKCSPEARAIVAEEARANIEAHVRRAEAAIVPPTPVGDLSCISDLMSEPLDFFSGGMGLSMASFGDLFNSFGNLGLQSASIDGIQQMICDFAEDKWQEVTGPLDSFDFASLTGISLDPLSDAGGGLIPNFGGSFFNLAGNAQPGTSQNYAGPPSAEMPLTEPGPDREYGFTAQDEAELAAQSAQDTENLRELVRVEAWGSGSSPNENRMRDIAFEESVRALRGYNWDAEINRAVNRAFRNYRP